MPRIITASERMKTTGIKGQIYGKSGVGKTSLLWTLPAVSTLILDLEAGLLSIEGHQVDSIPVRTWPEARDLACWLGGPNPASAENDIYGERHYAYVCDLYGSPEQLGKYETYFVDSTTIASQLCLTWSMTQPEAFSERTGKQDTRGAYGLLGREMVSWATQLQFIPEKNVWLVGGLEEKTDERGRMHWSPLLDGRKASETLPYIIDEVISMVELVADGQPYRAFVCRELNQWGFPAKDRSGQLDEIEEPHLGRLMAKIRARAQPITKARLDYDVAPTAELQEAAVAREQALTKLNLTAPF